MYTNTDYQYKEKETKVESKGREEKSNKADPKPAKGLAVGPLDSVSDHLRWFQILLVTPFYFSILLIKDSDL